MGHWGYNPYKWSYKPYNWIGAPPFVAILNDRNEAIESSTPSALYKNQGHDAWHRKDQKGRHFSIGRNYPPTSNSHHQDYEPFLVGNHRESLQTFICDWHPGWDVDQKYRAKRKPIHRCCATYR